MRLCGSLTSLTVLLAACGSSPSVPPDLRAEAEAWTEKEVGSPAPLVFGEVWKLGGFEDGEMLCGEFSGLPRIPDERVRFIYTGESHNGIVEPHRFWVGMDYVGDMVLEQHRQLFRETWAKNCEDHRPAWL